MIPRKMMPGSVNAIDQSAVDTIVDAVETAVAQMPIYVQITQEQAQAALAANEIRVIRGDTLQEPSPDLGTITGWTGIYFTVKDSLEDSDDDAIIQLFIPSTGTGSQGLIRFKGEVPADSTKGSISVGDETLGQLVYNLTADLMAQLEIKDRYYDTQIMYPSPRVNTRIIGKFIIIKDVTLSTSPPS